MNDILQLDAIGQAQLIQQGKISPTELVQTTIDAIENLNPKLNAVITPMYEEALEKASGQLEDAPFKGVPILIKDGVASVKGVRMTSGSKMYKNFKAKEDSTLVQRLRKAGFIIVGKTNLPEFGLLPVTEPEFLGACRNPWNTDLTPGGSSGGSASAVAARMVAVAHGNDGGGSIRIPASCCGLFGLKPTRGRNPLGPSFSELVTGLVAEHVLTRSVRDSAAILDLTAGDEFGAFYAGPPKATSYLEALKQPVRKLKIGYCLTSPMGRPVEEACVKATEKTIQICRDLGHEVIEKPLNIPYGGEHLNQLFSVTWAVGATTSLAALERMTGKPASPDLVEPLTYALYQMGKKVTGPQYELTRMGLHRLARAIMTDLSSVDVWISPTLGQVPVPIGTMAQNPDNPMQPMVAAGKFSPMTALFNISGQPATSVPMYWTKDNVPVGVQIVGQYGDETTLFQLSAQLEEAVNWQQYKPQVCV